MGSVRDSSPDLRCAGSSIRPPLSALSSLHPVSAIAPTRNFSSRSSRPQPPPRVSPSMPSATPSSAPIATHMLEEVILHTLTAVYLMGSYVASCQR